MTRVMVVGMGPIGLAAAQAVKADRGMRLVGLVDSDKGKVGQSLADLGDRTNETANPGASTLRVTETIDQSMQGTEGVDVAILAVPSRIEDTAPLIHQLLRHRLAVVSSNEEMVYPWYAHKELATELDTQARAAGRAVLGVGVNPGFVMDLLPVTLSTVVRRISAVRCERRVEVSIRRQTLQAKVGATLRPEKFAEQVASGKICPLGISESIAMLAAGLGRKVEPGSIQVSLDPVIASQPIECALGLIQPGRVSGLHMVARWNDDVLQLELDLTMAVGIENPKDVVQIEGPVQLYLKIAGGVPGDSGTVAALVNHVPVVHKAQPGLLTMLDVPPAGCTGVDAV